MISKTSLLLKAVRGGLVNINSGLVWPSNVWPKLAGGSAFYDHIFVGIIFLTFIQAFFTRNIITCFCYQLGCLNTFWLCVILEVP